MVNSRVKVILDSGKEQEKIFVDGGVIRVNDEANKPLSFDLAVNVPNGKEPIYYNRINVNREAPYIELVRNFKPGQQLFCEINVQISDKTNDEGKPYVNYWLQNFGYGRSPKNDN